MYVDNVNKLIFDTIQTVSRDLDIKIELNDDDRVTKLTVNDVIFLAIEYSATLVNWKVAPITYPSHITIKIAENREDGLTDILLYDATGVIDHTTTNIDKKVVINYGEGRTEYYRRRCGLIAPPECGVYDMRPIIADLVAYRLPNAIICRNPTVDKEGRVKTSYYYNRKVNEYDDGSFKTYHNSGFVFTTNRELYIAKNIVDDPGSKSITIIHPIKMGSLYSKESLFTDNQSEAENVFDFDQLSADNWVCYETYCKKKGQFMNRTMSIATEGGIIKSIGYHREGLASKLDFIRNIDITDNTIHIKKLEVVNEI